MNQQTTPDRDHRFLMGLAMGSVVGAGIAMWLAPRTASEIRDRAVDSARFFGNAVTESYQDARGRVTDAVDGFTRKGQKVRDGVCDTVARGAQDVERGARDVERVARDVERLAVDAKTHKVV